MLVTISVNATQQEFAMGTVDPTTAALAVISSAAGAALFYLFSVLAIAFPSGHLPGGRWGAVARLGLGVGLVFVVASTTMPTITVSLWGSASSVPVQNPAATLS